MGNRPEKQNAMLASEATGDAVGGAASGGYARLMAFQNDNVDALLRFHTILRDGAVEWSNDLLDFTGRHLQKHSNGTGWQINGATPLEAIASHLRYCQTYTEQCLEQTAKFLNLVAKVSRDSRMHLESHAATMLSHLGRDDGSLRLREGNTHSDRANPNDRRDRQ